MTTPGTNAPFPACPVRTFSSTLTTSTLKNPTVQRRFSDYDSDGEPLRLDPADSWVADPFEPLTNWLSTFKMQRVAGNFMNEKMTLAQVVKLPTGLTAELLAGMNIMATRDRKTLIRMSGKLPGQVEQCHEESALQVPPIIIVIVIVIALVYCCLVLVILLYYYYTTAPTLTLLLPPQAVTAAAWAQRASEVADEQAEIAVVVHDRLVDEAITREELAWMEGEERLVWGCHLARLWARTAAGAAQAAQYGAAASLLYGEQNVAQVPTFVIIIVKLLFGYYWWY
jgi:hypothetical protein